MPHVCFCNVGNTSFFGMDLDLDEDMLGKVIQPDQIGEYGDDDDFLDVHKRYAGIALVLVFKMKECRELKDTYNEMQHGAETPESIQNALCEYTQAYLIMIQKAKNVIEQILSIATTKMQKNDELGTHMRQAMLLWLEFKKHTSVAYVYVEQFREIQSDIKSFLDDLPIGDVIAGDVLGIISDGVGHIVSANRDNDDSTIYHCAQLFRCTDNVQGIVYAFYQVNEIIRLIEKPDMCPDFVLTTDATNIEQTAALDVVYGEIKKNMKEIKLCVRWNGNEFDAHAVSTNVPIYFMTQLLAFSCMLVEHAALDEMTPGERIPHMQEKFHAVCQRYVDFVRQRCTTIKFQDAELEIMSDFMREKHIIDPLVSVTNEAVTRQQAIIVAQLNEKSYSEWGFEMFFEVGAPEAPVMDEKTPKGVKKHIKRRHSEDPEYDTDNTKQTSAMHRIVREMIRCKVLPNVKKSKYTRISGG